MAKEFDVSQSAIARYEIDDSTPSPEVFLKYADYFDVSLDYISGRKASHFTSRIMGASPAGTVIQFGLRKSVQYNPVRML